jgi:hypothetical protein
MKLGACMYKRYDMLKGQYSGLYVHTKLVEIDSNVDRLGFVRPQGGSRCAVCTCTRGAANRSSQESPEGEQSVPSRVCALPSLKPQRLPTSGFELHLTFRHEKPADGKHVYRSRSWAIFLHCSLNEPYMIPITGHKKSPRWRYDAPMASHKFHVLVELETGRTAKHPELARGIGRESFGRGRSGSGSGGACLVGFELYVAESWLIHLASLLPLESPVYTLFESAFQVLEPLTSLKVDHILQK